MIWKLLLNFLKLVQEILTLYNLTHLCTNFVLVLVASDKIEINIFLPWCQTSQILSNPTDIVNHSVFALKTFFLLFDFYLNGVTQFEAKKKFEIFQGNPSLQAP